MASTFQLGRPLTSRATADATERSVFDLLEAIFNVASAHGPIAAWHNCVQRVDPAAAEGVTQDYWLKYLTNLVETIVDTLALNGPQSAIDRLASYASCVQLAFVCREDDRYDDMLGPTQTWCDGGTGSATTAREDENDYPNGVTARTIADTAELSPTAPW